MSCRRRLSSISKVDGREVWMAFLPGPYFGYMMVYTVHSKNVIFQQSLIFRKFAVTGVCCLPPLSLSALAQVDDALSLSLHIILIYHDVYSMQCLLKARGVRRDANKIKHSTTGGGGPAVACKRLGGNGRVAGGGGEKSGGGG